MPIRWCLLVPHTHSLTRFALLLHTNWYEQISDFGLSKILQQKGDEHRKKSTAQVPEELIGSLLWAAPEVLRGERGTAAADVYVVRAQLPIDTAAVVG